MLVSDYMTPNPETVHPEDNLRTVIEKMKQVGRRLPVVNNDGKVAGIITDRDVRLLVNSPLVLRERWQDDVLLDRTQVGAVMSQPVKTIQEDVWVDQAAEMMLENQISGLPVLNKHQQLVGIITTSDLLQALIVSLEDRTLAKTKK